MTILIFLKVYNSYKTFTTYPFIFGILIIGSRSYNTIRPINNHEAHSYQYDHHVTTERLDDTTTLGQRPFRDALIENNLTVMEALLR